MGIPVKNLFPAELQNGSHQSKLFYCFKWEDPRFLCSSCFKIEQEESSTWMYCTVYNLAYSSNCSSILNPVIENKYQLFMVERLIMMGAKTFIRMFKEDYNDLSLTDHPKKNCQEN